MLLHDRQHNHFSADRLIDVGDALDRRSLVFTSPTVGIPMRHLQSSVEWLPISVAPVAKEVTCFLIFKKLLVNGSAVLILDPNRISSLACRIFLTPTRLKLF